MRQLNQAEFTTEYGVTKWHAVSGSPTRVHSAIVNIRRYDDRRRVIRVYMHWDYVINSYVTEKA